MFSFITDLRQKEKTDSASTYMYFPGFEISFKLHKIYNS